MQGEIGLPGPPGHDGDKVSNTVYSKNSASGSHPGSVGRRAQEQAQTGRVRRIRKSPAVPGRASLGISMSSHSVPVTPAFDHQAFSDLSLPPFSINKCH